MFSTRQEFFINPEQNPYCKYPSVRRLLFWQRWLDPVILPVARLFCLPVVVLRRLSAKGEANHRDWGKPPAEMLGCSDHHLVVRSPVTGLAEWVNVAKVTRVVGCEADRVRASDAERNVLSCVASSNF